MSDTNPIYFTSARNYLKHDSSSGSATMSGPNTSAYSGSLFIRNYVVTHNLGYVPAFRVFYEPFTDGRIYPALSGRTALNVINPFTGGTGPGLMYWVTTTTLTIQLFYQDATLASNTYPIYWTIYKDYHLI